MEAAFKRNYFICLVLVLVLSQMTFASEAPFGAFLTPINNATVSGSISVTGWALDDGGVKSLKIYRDPLAGEGSEVILIAEAAFIQGAQPEISAQYSNYPNSASAGWGYMLLTNLLPNNGNGTFTLYAAAEDAEANKTLLGSKTIIVDNANSVTPFGNFDTPELDGFISGDSYVISGWALTPPPNHIPTDGSTIQLFIDGEFVGMPCYNMYHEDIATLFPGYLNSSGAKFNFWLDTSIYQDSTHTIHAVVTDNAGNSAIIGSRIFQIDNEPLSVDMFQLAAHPDNGTVSLDWVTDGEKNNLGFILERSTDNQRTWVKVASYQTHEQLRGQGTVFGPTYYHFQDTNINNTGTYFYRLSDVNVDGEITVHPTISLSLTVQTKKTGMANAYPNPFNPTTHISYSLGERTSVELAVYDMLGRQIKTLYHGVQSAGSYRVFWNGMNEAGKTVPGGTYIIQLVASDTRQIQKVLLLK